MTIVLVILMLFNFVVPNYSRAGVVDAIAEGADAIGEALAPIINVFARTIGDGILTVIQKMFIGTDPFENDEINIAISPGKIFSGLVYALDIDFISAKKIDTSNTNNDTNNTTTTTENISEEKWYKKLNKAKEKVSDYFEDSMDGQNFFEYVFKIDEPDPAKAYAYQLVRAKISSSSTEESIELMDDLYKKMNYSFNETKFPKIFEPEEGFSADYDEDVLITHIQELVKDSGLDDAMKEYVKYKETKSI